ncbi:Uncharacterised protein [Klebsiella pneumoniae]|nr:Uncharacterised protein [Klebsiella pneumoniae]
MLFAQCLGNIQRLLGGQLVLLVHILLESNQIKRQRGGGGFAGIDGSRQNTGRFPGQRFGESVSPLFINEAFFIIHRRIFGRLPACADNVRSVNKIASQQIIKRGCMRLIFAPPAHNQT